MKRTPLKRTPFKRKFYRLKRTRVVRNEIQAVYHYYQPKCEICNNDAMPTPHHIDQNHKNDNPNNFFSLCFNHHIGGEGIHIIGDIQFCERNGLVLHNKWVGRYNRLKEKVNFGK